MNHVKGRARVQWPGKIVLARFKKWEKPRLEKNKKLNKNSSSSPPQNRRRLNQQWWFPNLSAH